MLFNAAHSTNHKFFSLQLVKALSLPNSKILNADSKIFHRDS